MKLTKLEKNLQINKIKEDLISSNLYVLAFNFSGLNASRVYQIRKEFFNKSGRRMKIYKNKILSKAVNGTKYESLLALFKNQLAFLFSEDPISSSSIFCEAFKTDEEVSRFCFLSNGDKIYTDIKDLENLAKYKDINTARSILLSTLISPASNLARVMLLRSQSSSKKE